MSETGATVGRLGARDWARFVVPSATGILTFLVPISVGGTPNIGIGLLTNVVEATLEAWLPTFVTVVVTISAVGCLLAGWARSRGWEAPKGLARLFVVGWPVAGLRLLGAEELRRLSMESEGRSRVVHQVSFWDGLVIAAAKRSGCRILCSEDLQARATFEGADLLNPFAG